MVAIKYCGITRLEDAILAVETGADMLGFNFYRGSPRYISPGDAAELLRALRQKTSHYKGNAQFVGVFVNSSLEEIEAIIETCRLDLAQLSGDEPPQLTHILGEKGFVVFRSDTERSLKILSQNYYRRKTAPAFLVDASVKGAYGGTGELADWVRSFELARRFPIMLAGGLTVSNVYQCLQQVRPWGVDVASGIEKEPGVKDHQKMIEFAQEVRHYEKEQTQ